MEFLGSVITFFSSPAGAGVLAGLFLISEALASVPSIQANSIFQVVYGVIKQFAPKKS